MSVTRIYCNVCNVPLAWCECRTITVKPACTPVAPQPVAASAGSYEGCTCSTNDYSPPRQEPPKGRAPFRKFMR